MLSTLEDKSISHTPIHLESKLYSIWIANKHISAKLGYDNKDHIHGGAMRKKLVEKGDVSQEGIGVIDWEPIGIAGKNLTEYERLWVAKITSGFCAMQ